MGLSPRVRGNPVPGPDAGDECGSIPACAGEPKSSKTAVPSQGVYPRVCGGTSFGKRLLAGAQGLSPRVRGNQRARKCRRSQEGSIPACAGEPTPIRPQTESRRVYPRVCGGTTYDETYNKIRTGLSPRVRGNRKGRCARMARLGSIPACAGEPAIPLPVSPSQRVYPRVCGGTVRLPRSTRSRRGLSPRVRGNLALAHGSRDRAGSIPACAGEPEVSMPGKKDNRVYPRVCGGTGGLDAWKERQQGLSPRVRGNRDEPDREHIQIGSIPACAGEPLFFRG